MRWLIWLLCGLLLACNQPNPLILITEPLTPDGTTIRAQAGTRFEIVLPSLGARPTHHWVLQADESHVLRLLETREARSEHPRQPPPDYAPNLIFVFEALNEGQLQLQFVQTPLASGGSQGPTLTYPIEVLGSPASASPAASSGP